MQEVEISLEQYTGEHISPQILSKPLPDAAAEEIIDHLKQEADRYWFIDSERSLEFADRIIAIGKARNDLSQEALGWMARGDALRFSGRMEESWDMLVRAGEMFEAAGDEVGWARTRIGRLYLAMKLNRVEETLLEGREAQKILKRHCEDDLLVRLNKARAVVYGSLGYAHRALRLFQSALAIAARLDKLSEQHLGVLNCDIGATLENLGDFSQALIYYERAQAIFKTRGEIRNIAVVELNIAYIAQAQGHYRHALHLLHGILERGMDQFPMEYLAVKRDMTECFLQLNRYIEARNLAQEVVAGYRNCSAAYETARSLIHLATADGELGNILAADTELEEAQNIFSSLGATAWQATIHLKRGRIALKQGDVKNAYQEAIAAATKYNSVGQLVNHATALLLKGQTLFVRKDFEQAAKAGNATLRISQKFNVPSLRYTSHLLLGNIAEAQQRNTRAMRRYQAAASAIERVQRGLTITLRPGFLEDKGEASRALIALYLRFGQAEKAFETLEHSKAQVLLGYLLNRDHLRWAQDNARNRALIDELNQLRAEHQWFYRLAHEPPISEEHPSTISPQQALVEVATRERRMRAITEQLYLHTGSDQQINAVPKTALIDIQRSLNQNMLLLEFYNDGTDIWAFVLDRESVEVHRLPSSIEKLNPLLSQLQTNIGAALIIGPQTPSTQRLTQLAKRILERLYALLIEPLLIDQRKLKRLVIVPYGALHYLPFQLLYDGSEYLIEKQEVVILPTASLITQVAPQRGQGALILAHSYGDRLPHTLEEARTVQQLCDGVLYINEAASRKTLQTSPTQILHIAAHGQYRLDQPDLSYLQLADGQLYADDLMQQDLSYELVTLSGCETGRANVAARDELIGLGRGFLYAGAGALLVSQWRVPDASTLDFMAQMYKTLFTGVSKAAALRKVQRSILAKNREIHPAFWGAFQLIGNADPLSTYQ
jgi:CHAT domain-containing protein/predicted negative regulator of RcsB-dependent stress response